MFWKMAFIQNWHFTDLPQKNFDFDNILQLIHVTTILTTSVNTLFAHRKWNLLKKASCCLYLFPPQSGIINRPYIHLVLVSCKVLVLALVSMTSSNWRQFKNPVYKWTNPNPDERIQRCWHFPGRKWIHFSLV